MRREDLELLTWTAQRALDGASRSQVVDWAVERLAGGEQRSAIVELAALPRSEQDRVDELLDAGLRELGVGPLTPYEAAMLSAAAVAEQVGRGECEPIEAARAIWRIASKVPESEPDLRPFIGLASEWDNDVDSRSFYDEEIRARALTLSAWPDAWCRAPH